MRIIAGDFKGRRLLSPDDYQIRPTTDKVKEAMFSIVSPWIEGSVCADLFSGTGNLGLEAISRGAAECFFCDNSGKSINIIKKNIEHCRAGNKARIIPGDYLKALSRIRETEEKIDIFFLDPPYEAGYYEKCFASIRDMSLLAEGGLIVAEHRDSLILPDDMSGFEKIKERKYGTVVLSIYREQ